MKLSSTLLQAMALGITVTLISSACSQDDVTGVARHKKQKKESSCKDVQSDTTMHKKGPGYDCPKCGMG